MNTEEAAHWKHCSICKKPIDFGQTHWVCSVSTCNRKNTDYVFCSVSCWDAHLPTMRHRNAWAVEKKAPSRSEWEASLVQDSGRVEKRQERDSEAEARLEKVEASLSAGRKGAPEEILIVASRLKKYIKARAGLKTSDGVLGVLSEIVRDVADEAIRHAAAAGRSTVLDRDVSRPAVGVRPGGGVVEVRRGDPGE